MDNKKIWYQRILDAGLYLMNNHRSGSTNHFTSDIAKTLGISNPQFVRTVVRGMRAQVAYSELNAENEFKNKSIETLASDLIRFTEETKNNTSKWVQFPPNTSSRNIIRYIYSQLYLTNISGRKIGTLLPYELIGFRDYFQAQSYLSFYDMDILKFYLNPQLNEVSTLINSLQVNCFPVPIDDNTIRTHLYVMTQNFNEIGDIRY